jgi:hypothetical protein
LRRRCGRLLLLCLLSYKFFVNLLRRFNAVRGLLRCVRLRGGRFRIGWRRRRLLPGLWLLELAVFLPGSSVEPVAATTRWKFAAAAREARWQTFFVALLIA